MEAFMSSGVVLLFIDQSGKKSYLCWRSSGLWKVGVR
jgi:hypothetical protein